MTPHLTSRKIGDVDIFEIHGIYSSPWVRKIERDINEFREAHPCRGTVFNLREMVKVDDPGVQSLLSLARNHKKSGFWGHNLSAYFIAEHMNPQEPIPIFEDGEEVVRFFAKEFADQTTAPAIERRQFPRLQTALPVAIEASNFGQFFNFEAVITNLSEGGLFAYFMDSATEGLAHRILDPFDLKMMRLNLSMGKGKKLAVQGKLLRSGDDFSKEPGMAVEFYDLSLLNRQEIQRYLDGERSRVSNKGEERGEDNV